MRRVLLLLPRQLEGKAAPGLSCPKKKKNVYFMLKIHPGAVRTGDANGGIP